MIRNLFVLIFFALGAQGACAGFLDKVGAAMDAVFSPSATTTKSNLIATIAAEHKLPAHWRTYWLDEAEFGTRIFLADTGKATAPVLLLVHGLGQNGLRDWLPIVPELEKNYRVIMIDLPGFANSPSPKAKLSPTRYADLLHIIKPHFSNKPISVVGHSMGGAVTLRYAHRYPADINNIALIDAAGILQRTAFVKHSATDRIPTNPDTIPNAFLTYALGIQNFSNKLIETIITLPDPTTLLGKSEIAWGTTLQSYPNINAALSLTEEDFSSAIFEQTKPVFILWGNKDSVAPPRTGHLLASNLVNSHLTLIEDASHVPMASHAKEVSQWLLSNLDSPQKIITKPKIAPTISNQDYHCNQTTGDVLQGAYRRITLNECTGTLLKDVIADELIATDSVIEIENSHFVNTQTAVTIDRSVVMMTGSTIDGLVALDQARIDFAGVTLTKEIAFNVNRQSRLILSVSRAGNNRYMHGDLRLENTNY